MRRLRVPGGWGDGSGGRGSGGRGSGGGGSGQAAPGVGRESSLGVRLVRLLERQHDCLEEYIALLDRQRDAVQGGDFHALDLHRQIERMLVNELSARAREVDPLCVMIEDTTRAGDRDGEALRAMVRILRRSVEQRRLEALYLNRENRELLQTELARIRSLLENENPAKRAAASKRAYGPTLEAP